jgi:hypothetical protein
MDKKILIVPILAAGGLWSFGQGMHQAHCAQVTCESDKYAMPRVPRPEMPKGPIQLQYVIALGSTATSTGLALGLSSLDRSSST